MKSAIILLSLFLSVNSFCQLNNVTVGQSFKDFTQSELYNNNFTPANRSLVEFNQKEETEGSPYLLNNWAKGTVYLKTKQVFQEPTNSLNYDKTKGALVLKIDDKRVLEVNMDQIEKFVLEDSAHNLTFTEWAEKPSTFYIELVKDSLYSLYKTVTTKFVKANYQNKGLYETGNKFDQYLDKATYFIKKNNGTVLQVTNTNKKEINKIGETFPDAKEFASKNNDELSTETYLTYLVLFLNKR